MRLSSPHPQMRLEHGCVVSYCPTASAVGARVLREGGNAIDAAVATAIALSVTYPQAGNLAGGGFFLMRQAGGGKRFLHYPEGAPRHIRPQLFLDDQGRPGEERTGPGALPPRRAGNPARARAA